MQTLTDAEKQVIVDEQLEKLKQDVLSGKVQLGAEPAWAPHTAPSAAPDTVMVEKDGKLSVERVTPAAMKGYKDLEAKGYIRVKMGPNRQERRRAQALQRHKLA